MPSLVLQLEELDMLLKHRVQRDEEVDGLNTLWLPIWACLSVLYIYLRGAVEGCTWIYIKVKIIR